MIQTLRNHLLVLSSSALISSACIELNREPQPETGGFGGVAGRGGESARGGSSPRAGESGGGRAGRGGEAGSSPRAGTTGVAGTPPSDAGQGGASSGGAALGESGAPTGGALVDAGAGGGAQGGASAGAGLGGAGGSLGGGGSSTGLGGSDDAGGQPSHIGGSSGGTDTGNDPTCAVGRLEEHEPLAELALTGSLGAHDPVLIAAHGRYYLFHTGSRLPVKTSNDLVNWSEAGTVFASNPAWVGEQVPGARDLWAPDISYFGGLYHLYYSASTFGSNSSCIGHATRAALDSGSWTDHGAVICSNPPEGPADDWNAIDPNVVIDEQGTPWLSFGSFWSGIKLFKLDASGARANDTLYSIARRAGSATAIEAPFIIKRCGYYYLFVSWDFCCRGSSSTYRTMVGRSTSVRGPYVDRAGTAMTAGGGTLVLAGDSRWRGPGHNAVLFEGNTAYNVYHSYDSANQGRSFLRISELAWDSAGWPVSAGP